MFTKHIITFGLCVLITVAAQGAPIPDTYKQDTAGMLGGRWSESYDGIVGEPSEVGNELRAGSWDGSVLGSEWEMSGATVASDVEVSDETIGNLQVVQYYTTYNGGTVTLKDGAWTTGGDGDYTVNLTGFSQSTIVTLYLGNVLTITSAISMQGTFPAHSGYTMNYLAAVGSIVGGGAAPPPAGYPTIAAAYGQWGDVNSVQMQIVPEPATLSLLALGGMMLIRRKRR